MTRMQAAQIAARLQSGTGMHCRPERRGRMWCVLADIRHGRDCFTLRIHSEAEAQMRRDELERAARQRKTA